jgi:hypothetical protein
MVAFFKKRGHFYTLGLICKGRQLINTPMRTSSLICRDCKLPLTPGFAAACLFKIARRFQPLIFIFAN